MKFMRRIGVYIQGLFYVCTGINHFWHPATYLAIMPPWLPWHKELVFISGTIEILLGILLLLPFSRRFAAWGLIILLIAVFPANIQMAVNYISSNHPKTWFAIVRLFIQLLLIWWACIYTKVNRRGS